MKRVVTALSTAFVAVLAIVFIPKWLVVPVVALVAALVQTEFYMMIRPKYSSLPVVGVTAGFLYILSLGYSVPVSAFVAVFMIAAAATFLRGVEKPLEKMAMTIFGFVLVPFLMTPFVALPLYGGGRVGIYTLLYVIAATKLSDMGGFAFGKAWGRHKMCPTISPNKSWEGFGGSVFGGCLATAIFFAIAKPGGWGDELPFWSLSWWYLPLAGFFFAAAGTAGDLIESKIKREIGVKDSATFMPAGLGGFLDMFDSILWTPALFCAIMN